MPDRMKGAIVITSWICIMVIIALFFWINKPALNCGTIIFMLILYGIPFVLTLGYGYSKR